MRTLKKVGISLISIVLFALLSYVILDFLVPKSNSSSSDNEEIAQQQSRVSLDLVAIGDSLTEGVGDSTQRGGYVPLVADMLRTHPNVKNVRTANYGHAGDTSSQLMTLLEENEEAQADLKEANIIAITVGGNDLIRNFRQVGLNGSVEDFETTIQEYEENLNSIFSLLNQYNGDASIYIYGLYNPYHYYFAEFEGLQAVFDLWNERTVEIAENTANVTYVEIDSLFNPNDAPTETEVESNSDDSLEDIQDNNHPYLFEDDLFHPNDSGYKVMASALREAIEKELENADSLLSMDR
ncbi:SGNH/GDSL hydrolase family protein [Marinilactibacillus sp. GCM10026970]|uniref:SGNH/GDSL hydrolase family protein n=1 Tax=Marinilactibacillus sp. GCM10026970 TaxID=3252642 RepID=UPI00360B94DF